MMANGERTQSQAKLPEMNAKWVELGERIKAARGSMSKREAARRAGFSEGTWRQLEEGVRRIAEDITLPVNPSDANLARALMAVRLDPDELFPLVGRRFDEVVLTNPDDSLDSRVTALEEKVDQMEEALSAILQDIQRERGVGPA